MRDDMYSGLFGALTCEYRMACIANNLANANTTGYKQEKLAFKDVFTKYAHDEIREPVLSLRENQLFPPAMNMAKVRIGEVKTDHSQGSLKITESPLDMAIAGEGFFKIQTPGGLMYTRNGNFHLTADGQLVTAQGHEVLGDGGAIVIPPNARVEVNDRGQIYADGELAGQVAVVSVADPDKNLVKHGDNLYKPVGDGAAEGDMPAQTTVNQGYLEAANINIVEEMVNMIEVQRSYEAYAKVMSTSNETCMKSISRVGRSG